jgi:hypothetical protein
VLAAWLRPEERRAPLEYLAYPPKFPVLLLELSNSPRLARRHTRYVTLVNVGLLDSHPHRLDPATELQRDALNSPVLSPQLCAQRPHHPDR